MIKVEHIKVSGGEAAIRGMRNPMNSWDKSDSFSEPDGTYVLGFEDMRLMKKLYAAGTEHRKFMRMINVTMDITAPLYWWKEFDTYKVGVVRNSCSTMHKIHAKEFELDDFSHEHIGDLDATSETLNEPGKHLSQVDVDWLWGATLATLNTARRLYLETKEKKYWWQMIQLLPSSYNQRATVQMNYEAAANMIEQRENHKLDEWRIFTGILSNLPYTAIICRRSVTI